MVGVKTKLFEGLKSIGRFWVLEVLDFSQVGWGPTGSSVEEDFGGPRFHFWIWVWSGVVKAVSWCPKKKFKLGSHPQNVYFWFCVVQAGGIGLGRGI